MANLIDKTYFVGDISLPSQKLDGTLSNIDSYITKYEKEILMQLLGYDLYKDFIANPTDARWVEFKDGAEYTVKSGASEYTVKWNGLVNTDLVSLIAYYIYFNYMRDLVTHTSGIGEVLSASENAARITPSDKMVHAWNEHIAIYGKLTDDALTPSAYRFLKENEDDYDLWIFRTKKTINSFGI